MSSDLRICDGCQRITPVREIRKGRCRICARKVDKAYRRSQRVRGIPSGGGRIPAAQRKRILDRAGRLCFWCGGEATAVDHVIPMVRGGTSVDENLVASCGPCNRAKGDRLAAEFTASEWLRDRRGASEGLEKEQGIQRPPSSEKNEPFRWIW